MGNIPQVTRFPLPFPRPRVYTLCPCCLLLSMNWKGWNSDTPATAQQQHSYLHDTQQGNDASKHHWWELPQVFFLSQQIFCYDIKTHTHTLSCLTRSPKHTHTPDPTPTHNFCGVSTQGVVTLAVHGAPQLARLVKGPRDHLIPATVSAADDGGILHTPSKPLQAPVTTALP